MITNDNQAITAGQGGGTSARLRDAGLALFAERGFDSVRVGDIEERVGLVPRRGAMYRHFASKAALLEAAVEHHLQAVAGARDQFGRAAAAGPAGAYELGLWILVELDRQQAITRVLERDGERLPAFRDRFREEVSDAGYAAMAEILAGWLQFGEASHEGAVAPDATAQAVLLLGSLVNLRRSAWTFGASPVGVEDEVAVRAWSDLCAAAASGR